MTRAVGRNSKQKEQERKGIDMRRGRKHILEQRMTTRLNFSG